MDNVQDFTKMRQLDTPNLDVQPDRTRSLLVESAISKLQSLERQPVQLKEDFGPTADRTVAGIPDEDALVSLRSGETQGTILGKQGALTQRFGAKGPWEKFSGGVNYGTDFAVPEGTRVALPEGKWKVVETFDRATASGPNNAQAAANRGYGNSVLVVNVDTGEKLRFSHLSKVGVKVGELLNQGTVVGLTGATGNVAGKTGQHLDLEFYNARGQLADVLQSRYANQIL